MISNFCSPKAQKGDSSAVAADVSPAVVDLSSAAAAAAETQVKCTTNTTNGAGTRNPAKSTKLVRLEQQLEALEEEIDGGDWVPRTSSGKQKTPNQIRGAIRKFLTESATTQTAWLREIGINSNTFGRFMNGKYKDQWSACSNGLYWAASKFFARQAIQRQIQECSATAGQAAAGAGVKRPAGAAADAGDGTAASAPAAKKRKKAAATQLLAEITAVELPPRVPVYDDCNEVRRKIARFLSTSGVTQSVFLKAIGAQSKSLNDFRRMKGKGAGAANKVYHNAYRLFEQQRLLDKKPKSAKRVEAEARWGAEGYPLEHDSGARWVFGGEAVDPSIFDIDAMADRRKEARAAGLM